MRKYQTLLNDFSDLGRLRHRWTRSCDLDGLDPSTARRTNPHPDPVAGAFAGFIVAIATRRSSGFLTAPEEKDPTLGDQDDAWVFPSRAAASHALHLGLGRNLRACRTEVRPAICNGDVVGGGR
jgi:hypothetical protein